MFREDGYRSFPRLSPIFDLPDDLLAVIRKWLASKQQLVGDGGALTIEPSLPHGNVAAVLGTLEHRAGSGDRRQSGRC